MEQATQQRTRAFARQLAGQGFNNATKAMQIVSPHLTQGSAAVQAHRVLSSDKGKEIMSEELGKIAEPEEIERFFTSIMRSTEERTPDRLKAGEMGAKIKGMLIDKSQVETTDKSSQDEITKRAAELALEMFREANKLVETQGKVGEGRKE